MVARQAARPDRGVAVLRAREARRPWAAEALEPEPEADVSEAVKPEYGVLRTGGNSGSGFFRMPRRWSVWSAPGSATGSGPRYWRGCGRANRSSWACRPSRGVGPDLQAARVCGYRTCNRR